MAVKQIDKTEKVTDPCPRCNTQLLTIDGTFIRWLTCPECKYKKLIEKKEKKTVKVVPLK